MIILFYIYHMENQVIYKKGTEVTIDEWIVLDQSDDKCKVLNGVVISDPTVEKAQGYEDEYNIYIDVKMECGMVLTFNSHELNIK